jgi:hypothetical protein
MVDDKRRLDVSPASTKTEEEAEDAVCSFDQTWRDELDQETIECVAEPKCDGLDIDLPYEDGRLEAYDFWPGIAPSAQATPLGLTQT